MFSWWPDLRHALRTLAATPGFTAIAVLTLALGIAGSTAIFSIVNAVLLHRLPYPQPDRLVSLSVSNRKRNFAGAWASIGIYQYLRARNSVFSEISGASLESVNILGGALPEQVPAARITASFLPAIGVNPFLGRNFLAQEDRPGGASVAMISYGLWERRFHSSPQIVGQTLLLDTSPYTIIAVMPPGFDLPARDLQVWLTNLQGSPVVTPQQIEQGAGYILPIARLKPGVSIQQADSQVQNIQSQYHRDNPGHIDADPDSRLDLITLDEQRVQNIRPTLLVLTGAVLVVLLIACANNAALLLVRGAAQRREVAIRAALGASSSRLVRHLFAECLTVATLGGMAGLVLARWATFFLSRLVESSLPAAHQVQWDGRVLLAAVAISFLSAILCALAPSLQLANPDLNAILRDGGRGSEPGLFSQKARSLLVVAQVAFSMVLLIGAGLLLRSFLALQAVDPGFTPQNVLSLHVNLPLTRFTNDAQRANYLDRVLRSLTSLPQVASAGAARSLPLAAGVVAPVIRGNDAKIPFAKRPLAAWQSATPGYFETLQIRLLQGRFFTSRDRAGAPYVAIVNETMAKRFWPGENPLGKHLVIARAELDSEVVGVIADVKTNGLDSPTAAEMYTPFAQRTWPAMTVTVRTRTAPEAAANSIESSMLALDPDEPVTDVKTLDQVLAESFGQRTIALQLIAAFAGVAVVLALIGLYGVISYSVTQRTREIGIRRAVGANFQEIVGLILAQGLRLVFAGAVLGVIASLALTRLMQTLLYGVTPTDPAVILATPFLFILVACAAVAAPAYRAARVDPVVALR